MDIKDLDIEKIVENFNNNSNNNAWKNENKFNDFIEFLYNNVDTGCHVCSDLLYYNEDDNSCPYNYRDFENYLFSLHDAVENYAHENYIPMVENYYLDNYYFVLKYKDKFFSLECISGQGSFIQFKCLKDFDVQNDYIDYEFMINNKKTLNYNLNLEKAIFNDLDEVFSKHSSNNISKELITNIFEKYIHSK